MAMTSGAIDLARPRSRSVFRTTARDAWPFALGLAYAALPAGVLATGPRGVWTVPAAILVGLGTVWISNTVSHLFLHRPFFASRRLNQAFSLYLTAVLLVPQTLWKERHLWHHAGERAPFRARRKDRIAFEIALVAAVLAGMAVVSLRATLLVIVPGFALGMALARVQGYFEHHGDPGPLHESGVTHRGWLYNLLWFNDGYHAEHHLSPGTHWTLLPTVAASPRRTSARAPLLRWTERSYVKCMLLGALERGVLGSRTLQAWVLERHVAAFARLPLDAPRTRSVAIVGGGMFPRTALVFRRLFPDARILVIDGSATSVAALGRFFAARALPPPEVDVAWFDPERHRGFDVVIFPLAFAGDGALVARATRENAAVVVHDWIFSAVPRAARATSHVSWFFLKRLTLFSREAP